MFKILSKPSKEPDFISQSMKKREDKIGVISSASRKNIRQLGIYLPYICTKRLKNRPARKEFSISLSLIIDVRTK